MDFKQGGQAIQRIRKERGMTQEQLAEITNVASNSISRIERGLLMPALPTLIDICNALEPELMPPCQPTLRRILRFGGHLWRRSWESWIWRNSIRLKLSSTVLLKPYRKSPCQIGMGIPVDSHQKFQWKCCWRCAILISRMNLWEVLIYGIVADGGGYITAVR